MDAVNRYLPSSVRRRFLPVALIWLFFFFLYCFTAAPSISELFSDTLEFQLVVPSFAIAHPTGYPLYTLLGGLWSRLLFPFGNWAWRMNVFSALAGASAVTLLSLLAARLSSSSPSNFRLPWAALAFGLIPVWWQQSTIAEVYTLHMLLVGAILWLSMKIGNIPPSALRAPHSVFILSGLALAHHRTTLLLLPALSIYLLWRQPTLFRPQRAWLQWLVALLAPLLLYAYLPLRATQGMSDLRGDYVNSWAGFADHVLALGYTGFFQANELGQKRSWLDWIGLFQQQLGSWVLVVAIVGLLVVFWRRKAKNRAEWVFVALVLVTNLIFAVNYQVGDVEVFLLPVFFCAALFFNLGMEWLLTGLGNRPLVRNAASLAGVALLLYSFNWQAALQQAKDWSIHDYAVAMAKSDFPPASRVIGLEGEMTALRYLQAAEGLGMNAQAIWVKNDDQRRTQIAESIAAGFPTFLTRELPRIEDLYSFSGEGVLVRVWALGQTQLAPLQHPLAIDLADGALKLIGYELRRLDQAGGSAWQLSLDWQPQQAIQPSLKLSLRWLDATGATLIRPDGSQGQDEFPLRQVSPTNHWRVGETVRDVQIVALPAQLKATTLQVIVYDSATGIEAGRWQVDLQ